MVLLDDVAIALLGTIRGTFAGRLGRALRVALALVLVETVAGGHTHSVPARPAVWRVYGVALNRSGPESPTRQYCTPPSWHAVSASAVDVAAPSRLPAQALEMLNTDEPFA